MVLVQVEEVDISNLPLPYHTIRMIRDPALAVVLLLEAADQMICRKCILLCNHISISLHTAALRLFNLGLFALFSNSSLDKGVPVEALEWEASLRLAVPTILRVFLQLWDSRLIKHLLSSNSRPQEHCTA